MVADTSSTRAMNRGPACWPSMIGKMVEHPQHKNAPGTLRHEDGRYFIEWPRTSSGVQPIMYLDSKDTISLSTVVTINVPRVAPLPQPLATYIEPMFRDHTLNVRRRLFHIGVGIYNMCLTALRSPRCTACAFSSRRTSS